MTGGAGDSKPDRDEKTTPGLFRSHRILLRRPGPFLRHEAFRAVPPAPAVEMTDSGDGKRSGPPRAPGAGRPRWAAIDTVLHGGVPIDSVGVGADHLSAVPRGERLVDADLGARGDHEGQARLGDAQRITRRGVERPGVD